MRILPLVGRCRNSTESGDAGGGPRKSSLLFLTDFHPEIGLSGGRVLCQVKHHTSCGVWCALKALENPGETMIFKSRCTHNHSRSPR